MSKSRKEALKRLEGLVVTVREHAREMALELDAQAMEHWKGELHSWLDFAERVLAQKEKGALPGGRS